MTPRADLVVRHGRTARDVRLADYLSPDAADGAESAANRWIKQLRSARVDAVPLRDRFLLRGDSLWWFTELYLHKRRTIVRAFAARSALTALIAELAPQQITVTTVDEVVRCVARELGRSRGVEVEATAPDTRRRTSFQQSAKALFHTAASALDRVRPVRAPRARSPRVAAFVHSAFWQRLHGEESYIGPVLRELQAQLREGDVRLVGLGPRTNFRVRRWSDRAREFGDPVARDYPFAPIEAYASWDRLRESRRIWRDRRAIRAALHGSDDLRSLARLADCDLWPLVSIEFDGIADLQLPWSARAMDEAAAALDALTPGVVVTYAEAGGWGRALMLETRRRQIPSVGLQHGFIYRHWLNYLHEPDEMQPSAGNPLDRGFPRPDCTVVFDGFAARHLEREGSFPPGALAICGSPRLDAFAAAAERMTAEDTMRLRADARVATGQHLVLVAAKHAQLGAAFRRLVDITAARGDVRLVVKPHPGEAVEPYQRDAAGAHHVTLLPASADLAAFTAAARVLVTANSTAAIEAMIVDVPALVVPLPSNLSPFVEAGAMAGAGPDTLPVELDRLLYDGESRSRLKAARRAFLERYGIRADGRAAARSAETILRAARNPE
jgi:hypothetical protein